MESKTEELLNKKSFCLECENKLICDTEINENFILFIRDVLKSSVLKMAGVLSDVFHNKCFYICFFLSPMF